MKVREIMAKQVWTCFADEPLTAAARIMWEHDVGVVPVMDREGKLVGILTDRDICMSAYFTGVPLGEIPARSAMSTEVFCARPAQTIESAEELMRARQVHRLPVQDEAGNLVGMVSLSDLARAATGGARGAGTAVTATLAAIVEPRARAAGQA